MQCISMFLKLVGKKRPSGPSGISEDSVYWALVLKKKSESRSERPAQLMAGKGKPAEPLDSLQPLQN